MPSASISACFKVLQILAYVLNLQNRWRFRNFKGPKPALLLGNLSVMRKLMTPVAYTKWAQEFGPIYKVFIVRRPVLVVTDVQLARQLMVKQFKAFHDRGRFGNRLPQGKRLQAETSGMLPARGDYWAALRAGIQPMFHTASLEGYTSSINKAVDVLSDNLQSAAERGEVVDMWRQLGKMTMQNARKHLDLASAASSRKLLSDWDWLKIDKDNEYRVKGATPTENSVIGMLLRARNRNIPLTDALTLSDLDSLPFSAAVLQEALRLYPPAGMTDRECGHDLGNHVIRKGTWIHINIYGMHRDERYFKDPHVFKPERWVDDVGAVLEPAAWMPFGAGPRRCPGERLAVQEGLIALVRLLKTFEFELPAELQEGELPLRFLITMGPKNGLPMTVTSRP
eukprot:jgi/Astpho2/140/Aster-04605